MDQRSAVAAAQGGDARMAQPARNSVSASGELISDSPEGTRQIGERIGQAAAAATFVALVGPLGAGKTQLTKGIAHGLGVKSVVNSPTYILMNEHIGRLRLFHIDAYRLDDPQDALVAGLLDDRQASGVTVAEWADRLADYLPDERLDVELLPDATADETRRLRWTARGAVHIELARAALGDGEPA